MAKRIRVVTAGGDTATRSAAPKLHLPVVKADTAPTQTTTLSPNERAARKLYATTTTMGARSSSLGLGSDLGMRRSAGDTIDSGNSQFYSPQLSTDFLEKPQNIRERRAFYRFFYNTNEIIGQAIDVHSTLPLSKLRLVPPKGKNKHQNDYVFKYFQNMCEDMKLFKTLIEVTHEYFLMGNCFIFAEEHDWREGIGEEQVGEYVELAKKKSQYLKEKFEVTDKNPLFKGWKKLIVLPPDQVRVRKLPLTDEVAIDYTPDPETRKFLTEDYSITDWTQPDSPKNKYQIPEELKEKVRLSGVIPMDTDPDTGSYVYHLARKKSQYEPLGVSIVERCINTLVLLDKLRQAQTSIASRHMTPMRIVWADQLNDNQVDNLREQVDLAMVDPDYSIIANYEVHWEEMGSNGRLLDISVEHEAGLNRLFAGMGVTREVLTGEGTYTGNKIGLEVMNQMYLLFREQIQDYVENYLFKPIAKKKGFIEYDQYGNEILLYPKLSFTRLAIRDNDRFFDAAFQLYQKGSLSIDLILDILNVDPDSTREKLEADMFTVNDSMFNEVFRNAYTNAAAPLVETTDMVEKLAAYMGLSMKPPEEEAGAGEEGGSRFSSAKTASEEPEPVPETPTVSETPKVQKATPPPATVPQAEEVPAVGAPEGVQKERIMKMARMVKYFQNNPAALDGMFKGK